MFLRSLQFETESLFGTAPFPKRAPIRYHPARTQPIGTLERRHDEEKRGRGSAQQKWQIRALAQHRAQTLVYLRVNAEIACWFQRNADRRAQHK
jgi:hypothetical protein